MQGSIYSICGHAHQCRWNQKLLVDNPDFLNLYKRLSIQPLIFANTTLMFTISQHLDTLCVEGKFKRIG